MVAYGIVEPIFRMLKIDAMLLRTGLDSRLRPLTFSFPFSLCSNMVKKSRTEKKIPCFYF